MVALPRSRILVALAIAVFAGLLAARGLESMARFDFGMRHSDFAVAWFGARALLEGNNPYEVIGLGKAFYAVPLLYPAPALVAALPFTFLSEQSATVLFVAASSLLLALGVSRGQWHLMPIFLTDAFMGSASLGQWSILFTAALFFPALNFFAIAKPQAAIPVLLSLREASAFRYAAVGAVVLLGASFVLMPDWVSHWLANVRDSEHMAPPVTRMFGFLILLAATRWRRREAWLLLFTAVLPQSWGWYGTLALFTIPSNWLESIGLLVWSSAVLLVSALVLPSGLSSAEFYSWVGASVVISVYLPCTLLVLGRSNNAVLESHAGGSQDQDGSTHSPSVPLPRFLKSPRSKG